LACKKIADSIRGKSADQIRKQFNIENDFTPEEQLIVDAETKWCEEAFAN
jgi:S-phase kinase-associated protein 1